MAALVFLFFEEESGWFRLFVPPGAESDDGCLRLARRFIQLEKGRRRECLSSGDVSNKVLHNEDAVALPRGRGGGSAVAIVAKGGSDRDFAEEGSTMVVLYKLG